MALDQVLSELRRSYQEQASQPKFRGVIRLTGADVQRWAGLLGTSRPDFYDELAVRLARGFDSTELSFEFCDAILNGIHDVITNADEERPALFWSVYLAFDEGEYYHNHNRQEDPVETYTRPLIARIVGSVS